MQQLNYIQDLLSRLKPAEYLSDEELARLKEENLKDRVELLDLCEKDPAFATKVKDKCAKDINFWMQYFCCTFDPRPECLERHIPFIPYDYQTIATNIIIEQIRTGQDMLSEKSRDMGITWTLVYVFQWFWQFHPGNNFLCGSKKQDNVDKLGDDATIFEKYRYNIKRQPAFLMPMGFNAQKHLTFLKCINPENGNAITGESMNPDFGRSGRYTAIFFDEMAFWDQGHLAWAACGESTRCRIAVSTPFGKGNKFATLRWHTKILVLTLYWIMHPRKTKNLKKNKDGKYISDWYDWQITRTTEDERARELDIDYTASRAGRVYKNWNSTRQTVKGLRDICLNDAALKHLPITRVWDFGLHPACVYYLSTPFGLRILKELIPDDSPTLGDFVVRAKFETNRIFSGRECRDICDVAGRSKNHHTGQTSIDILNEHDIYPIHEQVPIEDGIVQVERLIDKQDGLLVDTDCTITIDAFDGGYFRKPDPTGMGREMPPSEVHPYEEAMDCCRYVVWWDYKPRNEGKAKKEQEFERKARLFGEVFEI